MTTLINTPIQKHWACSNTGVPLQGKLPNRPQLDIHSPYACMSALAAHPVRLACSTTVLLPPANRVLLPPILSNSHIPLYLSHHISTLNALSRPEGDLKSTLQVLQTGDVIAFYNSVFVPAVKTDLLRINQDRASLTAPPAAEALVGGSPIRCYSRSATDFLVSWSVCSGVMPAVMHEKTPNSC